MKGMMNTESYFCDTYALLEIIGGNPAYRHYADQLLVTSTLNLIELYYCLIRDYGEEFADSYLALWSSVALNIPSQIIPGAMQFKLTNKKSDLSYIDCMGYAFSLQQNMRFLTGDQKFEGKESVEFVK